MMVKVLLWSTAVYRVGFALFFVALGLGLLGGCRPEPIKIGFAGELTGRQSDLGLHGRNGAQLAVSVINEAGGINGRSLELVVADDTGLPAGAVTATENLLAQEVVAIVGHMTSGQTVAAYPFTEAAETILLSPAATTPELSQRDDYFFRVAPTNMLQAEAFAHYLYAELGIRSLVGLYDADNVAYSLSYWEDLTLKFTELGGVISDATTFSADAQPDFVPLLIELQASAPDGLFIIASPVDTALIAQQARLLGWQVPLFTAAWAQTNVLIQNGGTAVEGINIVIGFDVNSEAAAYQTFAQQYEARFGNKPTFIAGEAYEAVLVLAEALRRTNGRSAGLKEALLSIESFPGLIGDLSFDAYGDVRRPLFLLTVENGQYVTKTVLTPAE